MSPDSFPTSEYRLVQERLVTSAADALTVITPTVPQGKIWTIIGVGYRPSAAETRTINFSKFTPSTAEFALMNNLSLALNPFWATPLELGAYLDLLPGEYIQVRRDVATAGSQMNIRIQFVEWDLPLYDYTEPQAAARIKRFGTLISNKLASGPRGGGGGGGGRPAGFRGAPARTK